MVLVDSFIIWWLKKGRYPWSRFVRKFERRGAALQPLPTVNSLSEIISLLKKITWTADSFLHLFDSISLPEVVWDKRRDDCDGFAILAAALLKKLDPATNPKIVTVMLLPIKESHTVCVFQDNGELCFFDNKSLRRNNHQSFEEIVEWVLQNRRGKRIICWDVIEPESLQTLEFHIRVPAA